MVRRSRSMLFLTALCLAASIGARPFTRGVTYRVRMSSRLPAMMAGPGGDANGPMILTRASAVGNRARFDLQAFQPMPSSGSLADYLLVLDSGRVVLVSPDRKTYSDAGRLLGGGGLGMLGSLAGGRRGGGGGGRGAGSMPQMDISALVTDFANVGRDTVDGRQTQHYRIVAEMTMTTMGRQLPLRIVIETWTANLSHHIVNPFEPSTKPSVDDPAAKLTAKLAELRKKIDGTPIKTIITTTVSIDMGGAPMSIDFGQTTTVTDIKEADVDEKSLELPSGFVKKN